MNATAPALLRRVPYPYRALLAICSDLDETPSRAVYERIARFLNTTSEVGPMGHGVGLEVGNTMYFYMPEEQFAYWNTDDDGRAFIRRLIRSGHIDCFHSFGDLAVARSDVERSLEELARHGCRLRVWIDHATAPSNFGADIMRGFGDVPGSSVYHADLTTAFGVEYVWRGRVTSVVGQDVPRSLGRILTREHPIASARTLAKEWAKGTLAAAGSAKYAMHADNALLRQVRLRDGRSVLEFLRCNPYWQSVDRGETAEGFGDVVTPRMLDRLEARGGACILYTHLGKVRSHDEPLPEKTRKAFRMLAGREAEGRILVTTTRRLLDYSRALKATVATVTVENGRSRVDLECAHDLPGVTTFVPAAGEPRVTLNGVEVQGTLNPPDETGRLSVSLPWPRLRFPEAESLVSSPGRVGRNKES